MEIAYFESISHAKKVYDRMLQPVCRKWGLTRNALDSLLFLENNPGATRAADIVRHRGMAKSHVSQAVAELESRQLLRRSPDSRDRRSICLELTADGHTIAREGQQLQKQFFASVFAGLTREDLQRWRKIIGQVSRNIESL